LEKVLAHKNSFGAGSIPAGAMDSDTLHGRLRA
jgi:hypothetical protein